MFLLAQGKAFLLFEALVYFWFVYNLISIQHIEIENPADIK